MSTRSIARLWATIAAYQAASPMLILGSIPALDGRSGKPARPCLVCGKPTNHQKPFCCAEHCKQHKEGHDRTTQSAIAPTHSYVAGVDQGNSWRQGDG